MKLLNVPETIPEKIQYLLQPIVADVHWLDANQLGEEDRQAWQNVIDGPLKTWELDPASIQEDDFEPPRLDLLPMVVEVALSLRDHGVEPPLRVVPNGEGGVVFEGRTTPFFWSVEVEKTGLLSLSLFRNHRLVSRHQLA